MGPEDLIDLVPVGHVNFEVELRLRIAKFLPGFTDLPRLLLIRFLCGAPCNNCAGLQRSRGAQDAVPQIVCSDDGEADRLAPFFGHGKGLGKELLLDAAEKLIGLKFVFTRSRAAQKADMEHENITATGLNAVQHVSEMIERVVVADWNEDIAGARSYGFRC